LVASERSACSFHIYFLENVSINKTTQTKHMKKLLTLTGIVSIGAVLALLAACQTTGTGAVAQKESLLSQSGFKVITVTDPKQKQAVNGLAQGRCSAVTYNGKLYYVYPTATKDKIYVGRQKQFNAYKQALAAQPASQPASTAQQGQAQMAGQSLMPTLETAGPNQIEIQQFGGFGPMGVNALGDW
jgi:crotonobetainyl-CoA:carnitine CoA-transferase CaiB-like acyl-CoA transferase